MASSELTALSRLTGIGLSFWCYNYRLGLLGVFASLRLREVLADSDVVPCSTVPPALREASCIAVHALQWGARLFSLCVVVQLRSTGMTELAKVVAGLVVPDIGLAIWRRCSQACKSVVAGSSLQLTEVERLQEENAALRRQVTALLDEQPGMCTLCLAALSSCVFLPCAHVCCCQGCAARLCESDNPQCPLCRMPVENRLDAFLA
mmetsp:Transcript_30694/g.56087  ORF Transcript_30694/g.56087 Transcript_30694/m.56087 type:complete len:206 (-) Transcript_30694:194-811(-)